MLEVFPELELPLFHALAPLVRFFYNDVTFRKHDKHRRFIMFVWLFHRVSGVALLVLMALKIITGLATAGRLGPQMQNSLGLWHQARVLDIPLLFFFLYHGLYGVRTMLLDLGVGREKTVFWLATVSASVVFLIVGFLFYF